MQIKQGCGNLNLTVVLNITGNSDTHVYTKLQVIRCDC